jgi:uncharacterized protein YcbK (DUF882 family)
LAAAALGSSGRAGAEDTAPTARDSRALAGSGHIRPEFRRSGRIRPEALDRSRPFDPPDPQDGTPLGGGPTSPDRLPDRVLHLANPRTRERLAVTYCRNGRYDHAALARLSHFLRDWRQDAVAPIDPRVLDVLALIQNAAGTNRPLAVLSAYRTPATNAILARSNPDVARNSYHMRGQAIDLTLAGIATASLRDYALSLGLGGVGYYPAHGFIHVDSGPVRYWQS